MRVYSEKSGLSKEVSEDRCRLELYSREEYPGFQVTGMIEGFSSGALLIFDYDFFLAGNFGKYFFGWLDLRRDFFSLQTNLKIQW